MRLDKRTYISGKLIDTVNFWGPIGMASNSVYNDLDLIHITPRLINFK